LKKSNLFLQRMFLKTSKLSDVKRRKKKPAVAKKKDGDRKNLKPGAAPLRKQHDVVLKKKSAAV
jgi:hypothetical protein